MSEEMVVRHCAPTLAGLKTGSIFSTYFIDYAEMRNMIRSLNQILTKKGIRVLPLKFKNNRAIIYIYRPSHLNRDLKDSVADEMLRECGYNHKTSEQCIVHLIKRLVDCEKFPHEIGLFLGYPPIDVKGFIENEAQNFKCVGMWKVYGDQEEALKKFAKYKKCTEMYCLCFSNGRSLERLAVNI